MTKMTKAQLEVENMQLKEEIERLKSQMITSEVMELTLDDAEESLMQRVSDLEAALRPFANESILQICDTMRKRENEGVDIGVRVGALRQACELLAEEQSEEKTTENSE